MRLLLIICIGFIFSSCNNRHRVPPNGFLINLQPFENISSQEVNYVFTEIKKVYSNIRINRPVALPRAAYYLPRNRYRADSLIKYLSSITPDGEVTIGLTNKDVSTTKDNMYDWGVMGLGYCPGNACVSSTFRLSKNEKLMQLFKVSIHELGHTQGLQHCEVKSCFMRDAEGRNPTNEEKEFCFKCKNYLSAKGWK